jgi:hypothetical protein
MAGAPSWSRPHNKEGDIAAMCRGVVIVSMIWFVGFTLLDCLIIAMVGLFGVAIGIVGFVVYEVRACRKWRRLSYSQMKAEVRRWNGVTPLSDEWWAS